MFRIIAALFLATFCSLSFAEIYYEKIEVGTILQKGIGTGAFTKPIPLPDGDWLVVSKRIEDIELTNSRSGSKKSPRYYFTLKNQNAAESPIFALIVNFTPDALAVNWGNKKCEHSNPKAIIDDFGFNADSMLYVCAVTWSVDGYKNKILTSAESNNKWRSLNLPGLAAYPNDLTDEILEVNIYGNRFKGTTLGFTFLVKRVGDVFGDQKYADYAKNWVHSAGLVILDYLNHKDATFELPKQYSTD